jgi:hypothetical protein
MPARNGEVYILRLLSIVLTVLVLVTASLPGVLAAGELPETDAEWALYGYAAGFAQGYKDGSNEIAKSHISAIMGRGDDDKIMETLMGTLSEKHEQKSSQFAQQLQARRIDHSDIMDVITGYRDGYRDSLEIAINDYNKIAPQIAAGDEYQVKQVGARMVQRTKSAVMRRAGKTGVKGGYAKRVCKQF